MSDKTNKLIISFLGFKTDTITVLSEKYIVHQLKEDQTTNLNEVLISERKKSSKLSFVLKIPLIDPIRKEKKVSPINSKAMEKMYSSGVEPA